jgi:hypothetical protein
MTLQLLRAICVPIYPADGFGSYNWGNLVPRKVPQRAKIETKSTVVAATPIPTRPKALVFISHDSRDADLAEAFAELLADVSVGTLKSFRSSDNKGTSGIEFGDNWYAAILSKLGEATDVVALLTATSIDRPWILYEAGIAAGKLNTRVIGITLGVSLSRATTGPFGQFQNSTDEEESITKLMMQLLRRNPDAVPREEAVRMQVRLFHDKVKIILEARGTEDTEVVETSDEQNVAKLFEEVKEMVRELPERVDDRVASFSRRGNFKRRFHPMMFEELMFHPIFRGQRDGQALSWLVTLSLLRDDVPWLYEPGMEFYRALRSGKRPEIKRAHANLLRVTEMTLHSKFFHRFLRSEDDSMMFLVRHLEEFIHRMLHETSIKTDFVEEIDVAEVDTEKT